MCIRAHRRSTAAVAALALTIAACGDGDIESTETAADASSTSDGDTTDGDASTDGSGQDLSADLLGAGASFPDPVYQEWIGEYQQQRSGVTVQYEAIGSSGGREQF